MILKLKHQFDGRIVRVNVWSMSDADPTGGVLLGMLAMTKDEFDYFKLMSLTGGQAIKMKVLLERDEVVAKEKEGEIRISDAKMRADRTPG